MLKTPRLIFLMCVQGALSFSSCNGGSSTDCNENCISASLECDCCPITDSLISAKPSINHVNIFCETSGSMSGYMPSSTSTTSFQKLIPNIVSRINEKFQSQFYTIRESFERPLALTSQDAIDKISAGKFAPWGQNTSIPVMLDTLNNYQSTNDVSLLISDMIYSPKEQKLVGQSITLISSQIRKNKLATSLLSLYSDFSGQNIKIPKSPYYILIQGNQENINSIKSSILESLKVFNQEYNEVNFGHSYSKPYYSIIPYADITGTFESIACSQKEENYLVLKSINPSDTLGFWMGIDLGNLPNYVQNDQYLKANLSLTKRGVKAIVDSVITGEAFAKIQDDDVTDKKVAAKCTHFIRLKVFDLQEKIGKLSLAIKNEKPDWIGTFGHDDNAKAETIRDRTFGLDNFYKALKDAYTEHEAQFFFKDIEIILQKK